MLSSLSFYQKLVGGCWTGCVDIYGHSHQFWHVFIFSGGSHLQFAKRIREVIKKGEHFTVRLAVRWVAGIMLTVSRTVKCSRFF